jgi:hypothetical protein
MGNEADAGDDMRMAAQPWHAPDDLRPRLMPSVRRMNHRTVPIGSGYSEHAAGRMLVQGIEHARSKHSLLG